MTPDDAALCFDDWELYARAQFGADLWDAQRDIFHAVQHGPKNRTAVVSCNAAGKTYLAAVVALSFLSCNGDSIVVTTAPTWRSVRELLWREIRGLWESRRHKDSGVLLATRLDKTENWYAIGVSTKDTERMKGFHAKSGRLLVVVDEPPGVSREIFDALDTLMVQRHAKLLLSGNAGGASGEFYDAFSTRRSDYNTFRITAADTPNLKAGRMIRPYLITPEYVEEKRRTWGEASPLFRARIMAEFVTAEPDTLIPLPWIEACIGRDDPMPDDTNAVGIGTDVARFGSDKTVILALKGGRIAELSITSKEDTMQITGRIVRMLDRWPTESNLVDDGGLGGGVVDRLNEMGKPVTGINFGSAARDPERFKNRGAEMWWNLRGAFEKRRFWLERDTPGLDELVAQLSCRKYNVLSTGQIQVEAKDELKRRGMPSPDLADALALAYETQGAARIGAEPCGRGLTPSRRIPAP